MGDASEELDWQEETYRVLGAEGVNGMFAKEKKMTTTLVPPRDGKKESGAPTKGLMLLVGHPKSGKTTTAAKFPRAYVLELEKQRGDRVEGKELRIHDIADTVKDGIIVKSALDEFGDVLELAIADDSIKTIVIDTVDELVGWISADILRTSGKDPNDVKPQEKNFAFWDALRNRIAALCDYLKESGKLIILVAHCKAPEKDEKGAVIVPAGINVPGKGGAYLAAHAEMIGYISKRIVGGRPVQYMSFNAPSDMAIWGSGIDELDGKEIMIPKDDPYKAFAAMFAPKTEPKPAALVKKSGSKNK